jgi:hypothetical protein
VRERCQLLQRRWRRWWYQWQLPPLFMCHLSPLTLNLGEQMSSPSHVTTMDGSDSDVVACPISTNSLKQTNPTTNAGRIARRRQPVLMLRRCHRVLMLGRARRRWPDLRLLRSHRVLMLGRARRRRPVLMVRRSHRVLRLEWARRRRSDLRLRRSYRVLRLG